MFSTTATLAALLFTTTTVNAIPIWSRLAALAVRADPTTPAELAQGSNFFFDSLRLEDPCTPSQIGCISSQLATCSQEGNWEITPCTGNTTCLAVPASDDTGLFVSCILFTDAQADIGDQTVSVDFGVSSPPNNTETAPLSPVANQTSTSTDSVAPTDSSTDSVDPTASSTDSTDPTDSSTDSTVPTDSSTDSVDPTPTPTSTDDPSSPTEDPSASTCTDDNGPEETATELITVIIQPDPTDSSVLVTTTLFPNATDGSSDPTSTDDSSVPTPTDSNSDSITGTDAATSTSSIPDPAATEPPSGNGSGNSTCTEDPSTETEDPTTDTLTDSDPQPTDSNSSTDGISTAYGSAPSNTTDPTPTDSTDPTSTDSVDPSTQTGLTLTVPPNFSLPTTTTTATGTDSPADNVAPTPSVNGDISVIGTYAIPAPSSSAPARRMMMRVRRA